MLHWPCGVLGVEVGITVLGVEEWVLVLGVEVGITVLGVEEGVLVLGVEVGILVLGVTVVDEVVDAVNLAALLPRARPWSFTAKTSKVYFVAGLSPVKV